MTDLTTYFAIVCRAENMTLGYIIGADARQRGPYLADVATNGEVVVGEFATLDEARQALALAMIPAAGRMQ